MKKCISFLKAMAAPAAIAAVAALAVFCVTLNFSAFVSVAVFGGLLAGLWLGAFD